MSQVYPLIQCIYNLTPVHESAAKHEKGSEEDKLEDWNWIRQHLRQSNQTYYLSMSSKYLLTN